MEKSRQNGKKNTLEIEPQFTLLIPFSKAMKNPPLFLNLLSASLVKAEKEINLKYAKENAGFLIKNLRSVMRDLKSVPNEKTMAIFISKSSKNIYFFTPTMKLPMPSTRM